MKTRKDGGVTRYVQKNCLDRKGDLWEQANPEKISGEILDILGTNPANLQGRECLARSYSRACSWF